VGIAVPTEDSAQLLWHKRIEYGYTIDDDYDRYVKEMGARVLELGTLVVQEGVRIAQHNPTFSVKDLSVWCAYSPPWYFGAAGTATRVFEDRRTVTQNTLDTLHGEILEVAQQRPEYSAWRAAAGDARLLEQRDLSILLDGYAVSGPKSYTAREITLRTYLTLIPQRIADTLMEVFSRTFPNHRVTTSTTTALLAHPCNNVFSGTRGLLVEIGGQATSVSLIQQATPAGMASFPIGSHHLIRAAAPDTDDPDRAKSVCAALAETVETPDSDTTWGQLGSILTEWRDEVIDAIRVVNAGVTPPRGMRIAVETELYQLFGHPFTSPLPMPGIREPVALDTLIAYRTPDKESESLGARAHEPRLLTLLQGVYSTHSSHNRSMVYSDMSRD